MKTIRSAHLSQSRNTSKLTKLHGRLSAVVLVSYIMFLPKHCSMLDVFSPKNLAKGVFSCMIWHFHTFSWCHSLTFAEKMKTWRTKNGSPLIFPWNLADSLLKTLAGRPIFASRHRGTMWMCFQGPPRCRMDGGFLEVLLLLLLVVARMVQSWTSPCRRWGVSENVKCTTLNPIVPNGFADHYPYEKWLAISLGILTQHFQTNPLSVLSFEQLLNHGNPTPVWAELWHPGTGLVGRVWKSRPRVLAEFRDEPAAIQAMAAMGKWQGWGVASREDWV